MMAARRRKRWASFKLAALWALLRGFNIGEAAAAKQRAAGCAPSR